MISSSVPKVAAFLFLIAPLATRAEEPAPAAPAPEVEVAPKPAKDPNDISAEEVAGLLRQLRAMRDGLDSEERRLVNEALRALSPAAASATEATNLWSSSTRAVEFDKLNKRAADFEAWRKANDDKLHDPAFGAALKFQCRYLKFCLETDPAATDTARTRSAILALIQEAIDGMPQCAQHAGLLREDVFGSVIARRFGVEKRAPEGWPRGLLDLDGHFGRFIRTASKGKPEEIPGLWEARLKLERAQAEALDQIARVQRRRAANPMGKRVTAKDKDELDTKNVDAFESDRLPALQWAMGEDLFKAGMRRRGVETLFAVLRKYPKHPAVEARLKRITEIAESIEAEGKRAE